jgi:hypothetical protein
MAARARISAAFIVRSWYSSMFPAVSASLAFLSCLSYRSRQVLPLVGAPLGLGLGLLGHAGDGGQLEQLAFELGTRGAVLLALALGVLGHGARGLGRLAGGLDLVLALLLLALAPGEGDAFFLLLGRSLGLVVGAFAVSDGVDFGLYVGGKSVAVGRCHGCSLRGL